MDGWVSIPSQRVWDQKCFHLAGGRPKHTLLCELDGLYLGRLSSRAPFSFIVELDQ